jgi:hypothetical protein
MRESKRLLLACFCCLAGCARTSDGGGALSPSDLTVECAQPSAAQNDDWICPDSVQVSCGATAEPIAVLVQSPNGTHCSPSQLSLSPISIAVVGDQALTVRDSSGNALCTTEVTVVATPPQLVAHTLQMWPPNHKFHDFSVDDCVTITDSCDPDLQAEFVWASSDEPVDDLGDGHFAPDIMLSDDCQHVSLRSERQGPSDGRVYKLGVRLVDRNGDATEAECSVIVAHDQSGTIGADSGESYRINFDGQSGGPVCDGRQPPRSAPPEQPVPPPPPAEGPAPE